MSAAAGARERLAEPARLWVRYLPPAASSRPPWSAWPAPEGPWLDLGGIRLAGWGRGGDAAAEPRLPEPPLDDLLYVPPVLPEATAARDLAVARHREEGTPVLVQRVAGEGPGGGGPPVAGGVGDPERGKGEELGSAGRDAGLVAILDLTPWLLAAAETGAPAPPPGTGHGPAAVWPLLPGIDVDLDASCRALAAAGVEVLQAVRPELSPADRRHLVERLGEASFDAVFHGPEPSARAVARAAHRAGLTPFLPRPLPGGALKGRVHPANRRVAADLALAAELWLRLGRSPEAAQALFRSARESDRSTYDLAALAREGNLGVLPWLDRRGLRIAEEALAGKRPMLLAELEAEYLGIGGTEEAGSTGAPP